MAFLAEFRVLVHLLGDPKREKERRILLTDACLTDEEGRTLLLDGWAQHILREMRSRDSRVVGIYYAGSYERLEDEHG